MPPTRALTTQADRSAIMRRLAASVPLTALAFAVLAPLVGLVIACCAPPALFDVIATLTGANGGDAIMPALLGALATAYLVGAVPAAIAGVWVALLSPFAQPKRFYAGAAAIGASSTWLFLIAASGQAPGSPIVLAIAGAVAAVACAFMIRAWPESRGARRDRLARERAQRLARARA